jgi:hypothetical protein
VKHTFRHHARIKATAVLISLTAILVFGTSAHPAQLPVIVGTDHRTDPEAARPRELLRTRGALTMPYMSDDFANSFGVNTRFNEQLYAHQRPAVEALLTELGFRHIRDGSVSYGADGRMFLRSLCSRFGIHSSLGLNDTDSDDAIVRYIRDVPCLDMVEGPNELNGQLNWIPRLAGFLPHVYSLIRNTPAYNGIPVVAPSITRLGDAQLLADKIDLSQYVDLGNKHSYPGQRNIGGADGTGARGWGASFGPCPKYTYGSYFFNICASQIFTKSRPIWTTETGYTSSPDGEPASAQTHGGTIPYDVAAKYLPRLMAYEFMNGIQRTYVMALLDGESGCNGPFSRLGLVAGDCPKTDAPVTLSPKPPFYALKSLMATVADPGPPFKPTPLMLKVDTPDPKFQMLLLQKRSSAYTLVYWIEASDWDVDAGERRNVVPEPVNVAIVGADRPDNGQVTGIDTAGNLTAPTRLPFVDRSASLTATDQLQFLTFRTVKDTVSKQSPARVSSRKSPARPTSARP